MNSYNKIVIPKICEFVRHLTTLVDKDDYGERKIKLVDYQEVDSTKDDVNTAFLELNNETGVIKINFNFKITSNEGVSEILSRELYIPKMISNIFVIKGKKRIPTTTLSNSESIRIHDNNIVINDNLKVYYEGKNFVFNIFDDDAEEWIEFLNIEEGYKTHKDYFKFSQEEKLKIQIKLDIPKVEDYLTYDLLVKLRNLGPDKFQDSIVDKCMTTIEDDLIAMLYEKKKFNKILSSTRRKFRQFGLMYLTDIQNAIDSYFIVADEDNINIPSEVNPLVFDSLISKIKIPKNVAYNETFADLIDVVNTPENQNINRINELNVCCSIEGGTIYIECYKFETGEKVKLPYLEYLNSTVLLNSYYDYEYNTVIEDLDEYYYKLRLKKYRVKNLDDVKIDYVEPKPDEKLSISTRRIPLINNSDSVRVAMGVTMLKQSIEIESSEPRLISSGSDEEDYLKSSLLIKNPNENPIIIESIEDTQITYRDKVTNSIAAFPTKDPTVGLYDVSITYTPSVKVGDELKKGDVIMTPNIMKHKSYDLGTNALVFYMNYMGYTTEDAIVISESFAKRTTHYNIFEKEVNIKSDDLIMYIRKIGEKVISGDNLVIYKTPIDDNKPSVKFLKIIKQLDKDEVKYSEIKLQVPPNIIDGYIVDVSVTRNDNEKLKDGKSLEIIDKFHKSTQSKEKDKLPDNYKNLKIKPTKVDDRYSYNITYKIVSINKTKVGDKMTNSWGSKGLISLVLPDDQMPYRKSDNRVADALLTPPAVINRKNPSQLYEVALTKIIHHLYKQCDLVIKHGAEEDISNQKDDLPIRLYGNKFKKMTTDQFLENHKNGVSGYGIKVGSYSKIDIEDVLKLLSIYELSEDDEVILPMYGPLENPIVTGDSYITKLYHTPENAGKVTPSIVDSDSPYMGKGHYRAEGQKIGEMELWSLSSYGTEDFILNKNSNLKSNNYRYLNELLLAHYVMVDENKLPYMTNYRKNLLNLKSSINN